MAQNLKKKLSVGGRDYSIFSLKEAKNLGLSNIDKLPKSLKVLMENYFLFLQVIILYGMNTN